MRTGDCFSSLTTSTKETKQTSYACPMEKRKVKLVRVINKITAWRAPARKSNRRKTTKPDTISSCLSMID